MSLEIAQLGQPVLRQLAAEVSLEEIGSSQFQHLLKAMRDTLDREKGAGLAAPQVFVSKRVFLGGIYLPKNEGDPLGIEVFINPKVTPLGTEFASAWEGCLSFPELLVLVPRPKAVRIEYLNETGAHRVKELDALPARIVQHELDHLDGILTLDRARSTHDIIKASEIDTVRGDDE